MKNLFIYRKVVSSDEILYFLFDEVNHPSYELYDFRFYEDDSGLDLIKNIYIKKGFKILFEVRLTSYKKRDNPRLGIYKKIESLKMILNGDLLTGYKKGVYKKEITEFEETGDIQLYHELVELLDKNSIDLSEKKVNRRRLHTLKAIIEGKKLSLSTLFRYKKYITEFETTGQINYYNKNKDYLFS